MLEIRNLILAVVLSTLIMIGWKFIAERFITDAGAPVNENIVPYAGDEVNGPSLMDLPRSEALKSTADHRTPIFNGKLHGSLNLLGAQFDDLTLVRYRDTTSETSPEVVLLSPQKADDSYFAEFGWVAQPNTKIIVPTKDTLWSIKENSPKRSVLFWDNSQNIRFVIEITLDDNYMFRIEQKVFNHSENDLYLSAYGRINRAHNNQQRTYWISHEGVVGVFTDELTEITYKDLASSSGGSKFSSPAGKAGDWIGFADKYWFTALIPQETNKVSFRAKYFSTNGEKYQIDYGAAPMKIQAKSEYSVVNYFFAGAKELAVLDRYRDDLKIPLFDKAVDFGVLYFITKPVFMLLEYLKSIFGNMGVAIIFLTIIVRTLMLPLSNKSYISMFKLKILQPEIARFKELYKDDGMRLSKEIAALFKKNGTNPLSSFLPVIIQIPFFFALYKVLFVTIEMRHAPFFLWINDLSAPDPANVLTLFGLLSYSPPICIGILPIFLGLTMMLQQKVSGSSISSDDNFSANMMKMLPYIFVFIFASFPAGLIIYWICGNLITILQQLVVKRFFIKSAEFVVVRNNNRVSNKGI